jgi:branched-chain amino acid transport system substrate-binding protein
MIIAFAMHGNALYQKAVVTGAYSAKGFAGNIRIGAPISFQIGDDFFSYGVTISNAWNMFSEWVNDRGGINLNGKRYSVSIHYVEDYSNKTLVAEICDFLTNTSDMDFMFGPYSSSLTSVCKDITDARNILLLSGGSTDTDMYRNSELLFGTLPGDFEYAE